MAIEKDISRREFIKSSTALTTGLVVSFYLPRADAKIVDRFEPGNAQDKFEANAFVIVKGDDTVVVLSKHLEMGQGVYTGLATIVTEELDCDWSKVTVEAAPADASRYNNLAFGPAQGTGGSTSIANSWHQLREAGATARAMLMMAAAKEWSAPLADIVTSNGQVFHHKSGRSLSYGQLVEAAKKTTAPKSVKLKSNQDFKHVGQNVIRKDGAEKVNGKAMYGMDLNLKDKVYALVLRAPLFGATLKTFDDVEAKKIKGVREIFRIPQGVVVIADHFWPAKMARDKILAKWDDEEALHKSTADIREEYKELLGKSGEIAATHGALAKSKEDAVQTVEATYEFPFLAHAPMETLNCVVQLEKEKCTLWTGDQFQTGDQMTVAKLTGLSPQKVIINTLMAGGSFGRRANSKSDYIAEAVEIAKATKTNSGRPIHVIWTREDDIRGGFYRPFFMHEVSAGLTAENKIAYWDHRLVGQSIMAGTAFDKGGIDHTSVEGLSNLAYDTESLQVELQSPKLQVPILWWRSVGHTHTAFSAETMIDELAHLAKIDPAQFRLIHLTKHPRRQEVLKQATLMANWGRKLPAGVGLGVAVHESFKSFVSQVVQVKVSGKTFKVEKVWCAIDCGIAVNPDNIKSQVEGAIGFALSAALNGEITLKDGHVEQSNFHDYRPIRIHDMPQVEVHIMASEADPTGVGEPGVPCLAPALANAIFAATGKRLRKLPLTLT